MIKKYLKLIFLLFLFFTVPLQAQLRDSLTTSSKSFIAAMPPPIYYDFGDAPNTYLTEKDSGGPVHTRLYGMPLVNIGNIVDYESYAFTGSEADGDDLDHDPDEDAVGETDFLVLNKDTDHFSLDLDYFNGWDNDVSLYAWIDFDRSGYFDADEFTSVKKLKPGGGTGTLTWSDLKAAGVDIEEGNSFARFRITMDELTASDVGGSVMLGEVEDHAIFIGQTILGTEDLIWQEELKLLPNPVSSILQIESRFQIRKLEIYSLLGQKELEISQGFEHIDLATLAPGVYIVNVSGEKGTAVKKLVKI